MNSLILLKEEIRRDGENSPCAGVRFELKPILSIVIKIHKKNHFFCVASTARRAVVVSGLCYMK